MSIMNVIVKPDRAYVAVDTAAATTQGRKGCVETSKMVPLVHANLIFAARGALTVMHNLASWCMSIDRTANFDYLAGLLPEMMDQFHERLMHQVQSQTGEVPHHQEVEIALVGWSEGKKNMACLLLSNDRGQGPYSAKIAQCVISPFPGDDAMQRMSEVTVPDIESYMAVVANEQVKFVRRQFPGQPIGGRLIVAEITKDRMTVESVTDLG